MGSMYKAKVRAPIPRNAEADWLTVILYSGIKIANPKAMRNPVERKKYAPAEVRIFFNDKLHIPGITSR